MAERRYSQEDQQKIIQDQVHELRERGIVDARTFHSVHPGGPLEALKEINKETGFVRDQSQAQTERNKRQAKQRGKDSQEAMNRRKKKK